MYEFFCNEKQFFLFFDPEICFQIKIENTLFTFSDFLNIFPTTARFYFDLKKTEKHILKDVLFS